MEIMVSNRIILGKSSHKTQSRMALIKMRINRAGLKVILMMNYQIQT